MTDDGYVKQYEANLTWLQKQNPQLAQELSAVEEKNYRTEPSRSGLLTLVYRFDGQDFYIHSKFKPEAEAEKLVQKIDPGANHIVLLGLGLGYHLQLLLHLKEPGTRVLLVEPGLEILKHSFKTLDWKALLTRDDFFYCFGPDLNMLSASIHQFLDMVAFDDIAWLELPAEVRFNRSYFSNAHDKIDKEIRTLLYDFKTRLAEDAVVPLNVLKNINGILGARPVKQLENRFPGKPGIIVSAGPSLDKNILYLKKVRDRAVIICVDTALKPLLKRGIHPHFTITADPSYKNYLHLQGTEEEIEYFLVVDTGVSTRVYDDFNDHIFSVSLGKPIVQMIEQNVGEIGELDAWGSVISLALSFALYIGLDPIVFMGQDFAFSGMRNHCRGTSWEEKWLEYSRDLGLLQRMEKQSISGITKITELPDIYGNPSMSSDRLLLYKNYLARFLTSIPGRRFINASEGGVLTEIEQQPLRQVMETFIYHSEPIDFSSLSRIPRMSNPRNRKQLHKFFKAKLGFFKKYRRKVEESLEKLEASDGLGTPALRALMDETERLKNQLYDNVQNGDLVEMWSQGPIYNFLRRSRKLEPPPAGFDEAYAGELVDLFRDYFQKLLPTLNSVISGFDIGIGSLQ
jgi:hypothetical protein